MRECQKTHKRVKRLGGFKMKNLWGVEVSLDLKNCDSKTIRSSKELKRFLIEICEHIGVKRFKKPIVVNFGDHEEISGYSIVQLIETSLISGHFVDKTNAAYINLFSCKAFDPIKAVNFTKKFFKTNDCEFIVNYRLV